MAKIRLSEVNKHLKKEVTVAGWVFNWRSSGKIYFLQIRDGSGEIQAVVSQKEVTNLVWKDCLRLTIESSVEITGLVDKEERSPSGYEMKVRDLRVIQVASEYPIAKKEHGIEFLMDHRHLWIRSKRQRAILKVRDEVIFRLREFFRKKGFVLTDSPILTPNACEGTTTLFETNYFGEKAYLSQSGQLYSEAAIYALGRVYDFGPTFRAEKSKTRRHLTEFWMLDAEAAFCEFEENLKIQEDLICYVVKKVIESCQKELKILERNLAPLKKVKSPFDRITYQQAIDILNKKNFKIKFGDDFGADEETALSSEFVKPFFVTHHPAKVKAFYMQPDSKNPKLVLSDDLYASEGYGELIGGSERIYDYKLLEKRIKEWKLPRKDFEWYLDLRKYGSVPHSGFGLGLERAIAWICGVKHVRETIPFPRLINRLRP